MTTYTALQAGEEKALRVMRLEDDSSQATIAPHIDIEIKTRLSMTWQMTAKGLRATWQKTLSVDG